MSEVRVYQNDESLAQAAAEWVVQRSAEAIEQHGSFSLALSGGSTPRRTFELLADEDHTDRIDWQKTYVFWGDERCVPPDHPESNYRMARLALLDHIPLPAEQIYRMQGELTPQIAADVYERILRAHFMTVRSGNLPETTFDLVLLGLGSDGHTASLFPGTDALSVTDRWSVANYVPQMDTWRLTLTLPCINAASHITFLVSGENKAQRLRQVIRTDQGAELPASLVQPQHGKLVWLVDEAAASDL